MLFSKGLEVRDRKDVESGTLRINIIRGQDAVASKTYLSESVWSTKILYVHLADGYYQRSRVDHGI